MTTVRLAARGSEWGRRSGVALALATAVALQIWIARVPDTMGDALALGNWCDRIAQVGLDRAYFDSPSIAINYPPVYPAMLGVLGRIRSVVPITMTDGSRDNLHFFVKLPAIVAAVLTALFVFVEARRRAPPRTAFLLMLSFAFNPAVVFDSAYWGQIEAVFSLFVLLALCFWSSRIALAWTLMTTAVLTKAHAAPFAPVLLVLTSRDFGLRGVLRGALASLATTGVVLSPFIVAGHGWDVALRMLGDLGSSPFASQNAHNVWWIVSNGQWLLSDVDRMIGMVLFGAAYAVVLLRIWQRRAGDSIHFTAALVAAVFFLLMTGMHENHLYAVLPLLAVASCENRSARIFYALFTFTFLANMALHDPFIEAEVIFGRKFDPARIWIFDPSGPKSTVQWALALMNSFANTLLVAALARVWLRVAATPGHHRALDRRVEVRI